MDFTFRYDLDAPAGTYRLDTECPPFFTGPDKLIWGLGGTADWDDPMPARNRMNGIIARADDHYRASLKRAAPKALIDEFLAQAKAAKFATGPIAATDLSAMLIQSSNHPYYLDPDTLTAEEIKTALDAHANAFTIVVDIVEISKALNARLREFEDQVSLVAARAANVHGGGKAALAIRCLLRAGVDTAFPYWSYDKCPLVRAVEAFFADAGWDQPENLHSKVWEALQTHFLDRGAKHPYRS